ncbi:MAG: tRNA (adenosine(37)-N6)-threonylcarbamoyltransferase complex dimerization subunit type 1 TsaB [Eubacteriales bacterium]|nr:tRNA (adenosine(37)-N6)-threonylcarbamoyltransferase complex dimerization subunit type 1 TsaB [Eubacteriales bacterium]
MNILACDSTRDELLVVLAVDDKIYHKSVSGKKGHSPLIMELVDNLFKEADLKPKDIDVYSVCVGPGSFTGIRIGIATFNALAYATGAKRVEVNSFELLSYGIDDGVFSIDAGNGNLYIAKKKDGKIEMSFLEKEKAGDFGSAVGGEIYPATFKNLITDKCSKDEYVDGFKPLYLRKSQAERNLD